MEQITCECGQTYTPKDIYAKRRHEQSTKHVAAVANAATFDDLDDIDEEPKPLEEDETPLRVEVKPKRMRKTKVVTFADLDKTDAARSFTEDERITIATQVGLTKSVHDLSVEPKVLAESYVAAILDQDASINAEILDDLQTYVEGVVRIIRAESNGETPGEEEPKERVSPLRSPKKVRALPIETPQPETKAAKATKPTKGSAIADHKVCRICKKDKPLDEFRTRRSRPDGKDTLCIQCAREWTANHKAKQAASA